MEDKYLIAAILLIAGAVGGSLLGISSRVRDVYFFLLVVFSALSPPSWDINFMSRDWYRGTTRGFEVSLVDMIAVSLFVSAFLFPRREYKRFYWPGSLLPLLLFFFFAAFCVALADPKIFGMFEVSKMLRGMVVFLGVAFYVRSEREVRLFIIALAIAVCYQGIKAVEQRYLHGMHRVIGTVDHPNSLSMYLCATAPIFVAVITAQLPRLYKLFASAAIVLACVGVVLTISRTGVVAIALVLTGATLATMTWKFTLKKVAISVVVLVGVAGIVAKSWETLTSRFRESTLTEEYENKHEQGRGYYIRLAAAMAEDRLFGVGPNNWSYWVSNEYGPRLGFLFVPYIGTERWPSDVVPPGRNIDAAQAAPAHSLWALTTGEMGYGGLALILLLWGRWLQMGMSFLWRRTPDPMRRIGVGIFFGICGAFLQSLTEWVFRQTPIFFTFHIMMGVLASLYYLKKQAKRAEKLRRESGEDISWETDSRPVVIT